jgi:hypothetical protein
MISADLKRTHAVVVGVEKYDAGTAWDLDGPAADARRFVEWLLTRGVPAEQVQMFLAPLGHNQPWNAPAGLTVEPADRASILRGLFTTLAARRGDLLLVYWGGHGVLTVDDTRRLYYADATQLAKFNLDLTALLVSLRTDVLPGFPRQVVIVDACQNYLDEAALVASLPHETLPRGELLDDRQQFVLLAARPGEPAANSGARKAGTFSLELLEELARAPATPWPPDLDRVARRLLDRFIALRASGQARQTPIVLRTRGWDGREDSLWQAAPPAGAASPPTVGQRPLDLGERTELVDRLLETMFGERSARESMLLDMRREVATSIPRHNRDRLEVTNALRTCRQYPGGFEELIAIIVAYEGDSEPVRALLQAVRRILPDSEPGLPAPRAD